VRPDFKTGLGVSICLDMSRSRVLISKVSKKVSTAQTISTVSKTKSRPNLDQSMSLSLNLSRFLTWSRSRQFSKSVPTCQNILILVAIDCRNIYVSEHSRYVGTLSICRNTLYMLKHLDISKHLDVLKHLNMLKHLDVL